jgi:hypothetical protein
VCAPLQLLQPVAVALLRTFYQPDDSDYPCILELDLFSLLVSLVFITSYIFSKRNKVKIPACSEEVCV